MSTRLPSPIDLSSLSKRVPFDVRGFLRDVGANAVDLILIVAFVGVVCAAVIAAGGA